MATSANAGDSTTMSFLPTEIAPYAEDVLSRTAELVDLPYQPYEGGRVADFNAQQQAGFNQVGGLQSIGRNPLLGQTNTAIGQGVASFGIPAGVNDALSGFGSLTQGGGASTTPVQAASIAGSNLTPANFGQIQQFMSPYQQGVIDIAKREATRQNDLQGIARNSNLVGQGAFGGTRQAIMDAEAARNLNQNLSDLQIRGSQDAYTQAVRALEAQRGYDTGVQTTNAGFQQQANLSNQGAQAADISRQLQALQAQGSLGLNQFAAQQAGLQTLSGLNTNALNQERTVQDAELQRINALLAAGGQQQALDQKALDVGYNNFLEARDYDIGLLGKYANIIGSIPRATNQTTTTPGPSTLSQITGILGALGTSNTGRGILDGILGAGASAIGGLFNSNPFGPSSTVQDT